MSAKAQLITDAASAASTATYGCLSLSFLSWIFNAESLPWLMFGLAVLTFLVNAVSKYREDKRAQREHIQKMSKNNEPKN